MKDILPRSRRAITDCVTVDSGEGSGAKTPTRMNPAGQGPVPPMSNSTVPQCLNDLEQWEECEPWELMMSTGPSVGDTTDIHTFMLHTFMFHTFSLGV